MFGSEKYGAIYSKVRHLISEKSGITFVFSHYAHKKTVTYHNIIIHIKSVLNKDQNHYYCNIFLEKCLYWLARK